MSKYIWILVIIFTLVLIKVANNPKDSFAFDPNLKETQTTEPESVADTNQPILNTPKSSPSDVNEKKPSTEDANSTKELNNTKGENPKEEILAENPKTPEEKPVEEPKTAEIQKNDEKLSKTQEELYKEFTAIFADYINTQGNVDYSKLRRQRLVLKSITSIIESLKPEEYKNWSKEDKIAFWLNTYNLHKIKAIIENYPIVGSRWLNPIWGVNSIRHIKPQLDTYKFIVMNEEFTFNEVENRFFKDTFKEPRVFFAITMGTKSSPAMLNTAYQGIKLYQQLDDQIRRFLADENIGFKADEGKNIVYLSLMLKPSWYGSQFLEKYNTDKMFKDKTSPETRAVLNFIINYIPQNNGSFLKIGTYSVSYFDYNWQLNE
ncbi:MAG TPA: DUF547 domain-containing protein [Sedimentisphaerales bacterium]|nr:DUF547 domain-containing protein [Sedimentisphaerales bacterium]